MKNSRRGKQALARKKGKRGYGDNWSRREHEDEPWLPYEGGGKTLVQLKGEGLERDELQAFWAGDHILPDEPVQYRSARVFVFRYPEPPVEYRQASGTGLPSWFYRGYPR